MRRYWIFAVAVFTALLVSSEISLSLPIAGVGPDLAVIVLVAFAVSEQPRTGAIMGFAAGLTRDLLIATPAGLSAFAYAVTGYAAGLVGGARGVWAFVGLVAGSTFASQGLHGLGTMLVATQVDASPLPRVMFVTTVYNSLLAPLLMPLLRKITPVEGGKSQTGATDAR